jgi:hypothetical protein
MYNMQPHGGGREEAGGGGEGGGQVTVQFSFLYSTSGLVLEDDEGGGVGVGDFNNKLFANRSQKTQNARNY